MLFYREVQSGQTFYLRMKTRNEFKEILQWVDIAYCGQPLVVVEPRLCEKYKKDLLVMEVMQPLLPVELTDSNIAINGVNMNRHMKPGLKSFLVEVKDLVFSLAEVRPGCSKRLCDSRHGTWGACPALTKTTDEDQEETLQMTLVVRLFSASYSMLNNKEFISIHLAELFIESEVLQVSIGNSYAIVVKLRY